MESKIIDAVKIPVIVGPTCSGKTELSLILSQKNNAEIISADSRQIYKYLNIGTAKPTTDELQKTKHHFIDVLEPDDDYNVSRYESEALEIINQLLKENKIPIITGGSGLYIKAVIDGIFEVDTDENFRADLIEKKNNSGIEYLYKELQKVDPDSAAKMLPQNWKRIIRALEVFHLTGKTIGEHHLLHKRKNNLNFIQFGLDWKREVLYKNIEQRVDAMIEHGFLNEVKLILEKGFDRKLNSLNTVGYKEIISYLDNEITLDKAIELIKRNTRRYAKRQLTWFRADERIKWFKVNSKNDFENIASQIKSEIKN